MIITTIIAHFKLNTLSLIAVKSELVNIALYFVAFFTAIIAFTEKYIMSDTAAFYLLATLIIADTVAGFYRAYKIDPKSIESRRLTKIITKLFVLSVVMSTITKFASLLILPVSIIMGFANLGSFLNNLAVAGIKFNGAEQILSLIDNYKEVPKNKSKNESDTKEDGADKDKTLQK
jgi:hypothetical protein